MTGLQAQLEQIAEELGTTPAALLAVRPSLLEIAAERFERRLERFKGGRRSEVGGRKFPVPRRFRAK